MKDADFSGCDALHLYFDGELDTVESLAFERHLEVRRQDADDANLQD